MPHPYFQIDLIKKNLEILPTDASLDDTFNRYGQEGDAFVDTRLGLANPLDPVPEMIRHASSNYAAGRYLLRLKEVERSNKLIERAEIQVDEYAKRLGRVTVFG